MCVLSSSFILERYLTQIHDYFFLKLDRRVVTTEIVTKTLHVRNTAPTSLEYSCDTFTL